MHDQLSDNEWPFNQMHCLHPLCATLLPAGAELCDECGGPIEPLSAAAAVLVGELDERQAGFPLRAETNSIGRGAAGEPPPDVDQHGLTAAEERLGILHGVRHYGGAPQLDGQFNIAEPDHVAMLDDNGRGNAAAVEPSPVAALKIL